MNKDSAVRVLVVVACLLAMAGTGAPVHAANWLLLQGTERPGAPAHRFWGFVQPSLTIDRSDKLSGLTDPPGPADFTPNNGRRVAVTGVAPWFGDDARLFVRRARFGVRGSLSPDVNYFTLFETAPNLLTYDPFGERARLIALDQVSVTYNRIPHARLRAGLFKTPGPEESMQAIHNLDYIEFTDFTARETMERFVTGAALPAGSPSSPSLGTPVNTGYGANAVRDWGVQIFDSVRRGPWDLSWALMAGRGEAIHETRDSNGEPEWYLYGSAEHDLPGGRGVKKHGVKFYSWLQYGKREFSSDSSGREYGRLRYGAGVKALGKLGKTGRRHRLGAEFLFGDGMLFIAPAGGVARGGVANGDLQIAAERGNRSRGVTLDYAFFPDAHWELDVRLHRHDLLYRTADGVNPGNRRVFSEATLGVNYHFTPKLRLTLNYAFKDADAPTPYASGGLFPAAAAAQGITDNARTVVGTVSDRFGAQLTWIF